MGWKNKDEFKKASGFKKFGSNWEKVTIEVNEEKLSSVIGALAWTTNKEYNPNRVKFYIRDIVVLQIEVIQSLGNPEDLWYSVIIEP